MTNINLNFEDTFEGGIADGDYEVVITKVGEDATKGGTEYVDVRLTIRNDIDQKHKNQVIFHKIWKTKATGKYNMKSFNTLGAAAQLQKTSFSTFEELLNEFVGKPMKVRVKNETSEYNGNSYENLNVKNMKKTSFPNVQHQFKTDDSNAAQANNPFTSDTPNVDTDNLPF